MDSQTPPSPSHPMIGYQQPQPKRRMPVVLIVVIVLIAIVTIFALLFIGLVLGVVGVPYEQRAIIRANETATISSLRMLNEMEGQYASEYPQHGFACSLAALGGKVDSQPSPEGAELITDELASGNKSGYTFTITGCAKTTINNVDQYNSYQINAVPNSIGHSGNRGFCTDENALIRYDPKGGTNCTELLQ